MEWDRLIADWEHSLDEVDAALESGDWEALEVLDWSTPGDDMPRPTPEQRARVDELTKRQRQAAAAISSMLEQVGRELRDAAAHRGAMNAYESAKKRSA